ncbi:MAG: GAF domain-containing protein [Thermodesulfobacteriota bacterium]
MIASTTNQLISLISSQSAHPSRLEQVLSDVGRLYGGHWPDYEPCGVGYHTWQHALDVTLATARMAAAWNRLNSATPLHSSTFDAGIISALFHDSGYIKERGDHNGRGGKYTFTHVPRSRKVAASYLREHKWPPATVDLVERIITISEFSQPPDLSLFTSVQEGLIARMMATGDLVAQMADVDYMRHLRDLHNEFLEAYDFEGRDALRQRGIRIFATFEEMREATFSLYHQTIIPRLDELGRMDLYLAAFFDNDRNPYLENIIANLSGQSHCDHGRRKRLGEILAELNLVRPEVIAAALDRQEGARPGGDAGTKPAISLAKKILGNVEERPQDQLGAILMEMRALDAATLRQGILAQLLPRQIKNNLSRNSLLFLLEVSLLIQNSHNDPWIFKQIMAMILEELNCRCAILFFSEGQTMTPILQTGMAQATSALQDHIPLDKGLTGWVISHDRPAYLAQGMLVDHYAGQPHLAMVDELQALLAVPLHVNGELIGALELSGKGEGEDFSAADGDVMSSLATIISSHLSTISQQG